MFPLVKEFDGHRIERRPPGFEFTPGLLGKISTYVVLPPKGGLQVFAFMYSFLVASEADEERLAGEALNLIEDAIPVAAGSSEADRTFEYGEGGWLEVPTPRWWSSVTRPP